MTKLVILAGMMACSCIQVYAQKEKREESKGKAIIQVFGNFHTGFGVENDDRGFELDRSYLGYEYYLGKGLSVKGVMDIGKSSDIDDYQRIAYIKNALIQWKKGNLTLNGGLISTTLFNFQEKFWGYRYIMKSFQDEYKFGSSADLGISVAYQLDDWVSTDIIIVNGEGYKKIQTADGLNYGLGITLTPLKGLHIRLYGGLNEADREGESDMINLAAFAGYKCKRFTIGAEYNHLLNDSYNKNSDRYGCSVFAFVQLSEIVSFYTRFDDLCSKDDWNIVKDESAGIIGAQFKLGKYVKVAPNFRVMVPKRNSTENRYSAYVSCSFGI